MELKSIKINGDVFRQRRRERGLSVRKVEEKTGVSRSVVSNVENRKNIPDGANLLRLMFLYDLSKEEIALGQ